jgi:hypothetical protein
MLFTIDNEEYTPHITVKVLIDRARRSDAGPSRSQSLAVLGGFSFKHVDKFRANMVMHGESRPWTASDQLHRPAIGGAQIFHVHSIDNR